MHPNCIFSINWRNLHPGDIGNFWLWVKNTGRSNMTINVTANGWSPSNASAYLAVSWNQQNSTLTPNQIVQGILTLTVSSSITTDITAFNFNVTISDTG